MHFNYVMQKNLLLLFQVYVCDPLGWSGYLNHYSILEVLHYHGYYRGDIAKKRIMDFFGQWKPSTYLINHDHRVLNHLERLIASSLIEHSPYIYINLHSFFIQYWHYQSRYPLNQLNVNLFELLVLDIMLRINRYVSKINFYALHRMLSMQKPACWGGNISIN